MPTSPLIKRSLTIFTLVLAGVGGGYALMASLDASPRRAIASIDEPLKWQPPGLGKHLAPVRVQIILPEVLPENNEQEVEIKGYVSLSQEIQGNVDYNWILPEGVEVVSGQRSDAWTNMRPGQTAVAKIAVTGFSREQRKILAFEASTQVQDHRLGNTSIVSSRPEDSMEFIAPQKMKARKQFDEKVEKSQ